MDRVLLQSDLSNDACFSSGNEDASTVPLRIGGLFAILAASALGVYLPLASSWNRMQTLFLFGQAFAAGVVLATGFVHVLNDANTALSNPCLTGAWASYSWAFTIATMASILTLVMEVAFEAIIRSRMKPSDVESTVRLSCGLLLSTQGRFKPSATCKEGEAADMKNHAHIQALILSYVLECGIIFHSTFIGTAYGATTDVPTLRTLSVALCFHQGFEGLALGSTFVKARYGAAKYAVLSIIFVLITPLGIAIGLSVNASYNPNSQPALIIEGVFNSVAAGILIHTATVGLLHPLFAHSADQGHAVLRGWYLVIGLIASLAGAIAMSIIGIWA